MYIDGGEVSYSNSSETGGVECQYSDSLVYIDITSDFSPDSVAVSSIDKPDGVPNLVQGGLWVDDEAGTLYTGFAGFGPALRDETEQPQGLWSFQPGSDGSDGTWTILNDAADSFFTTGKRPFGAPVASGNGTALLLGGLYVFGTWHVPVSGLLSYNFSSQTVTYTTDGFLQVGSMQYVPNFGSAGILVSAGGNHGYQKSSGEWASNWQAFDTVQVFDIASGTWYDHITTGNVPPFRMQYCMTGAASSSRTYEILVYAGWNNTLGDYATSFDAAYVLSLPSFNWFKADYVASNPRHALTCEHIGGGQVLTIGGLDTSQHDASNQYRGVFHTVDPFPQGLGIFDLSSMSFAESFEANRTTYDYADALSTYYQTRDRISSSMGRLSSIRFLGRELHDLDHCRLGLLVRLFWLLRRLVVVVIWRRLRLRVGIRARHEPEQHRRHRGRRHRGRRWCRSHRCRGVLLPATSPRGPVWIRGSK